MESHTESHTKAIHFAIHKTGVAIRKAVQDGRKAIRCHMHSHTVRQNCHTLPYPVLYKMAQLPYSAICIAIQYGKKAIHEQK